MNEEFLQYIWKYQLHNSLHCISGEKIEIIKHGEHNRNEGPDFLNAHVKIDETLWVGNIELHPFSADWIKHNHHKNKAYDNVILHIVLKNNAETLRTSGERIVTAEIIYDKILENKYLKLLASELWIPCQNEIAKIDRFVLQFWLNSLMFERLKSKSERIQVELEKSGNNWEETFYQFLAQNFGMKINDQPFLRLAKSLPVKILVKHKDNLFQIESLLFGQSGLLDGLQHDEYSAKLQTEYQFLQKKYSLKPIQKHEWKFLRIRPSNFPTIRISQFAQLVYKSLHLFSKILEVENQKSFSNLLNTEVSEYWNTHFVFGKKTVFKKKTSGNELINNIIINTIVPFVFLYGLVNDKEDFRNKAISFLENLKAENNSIINKWKEIGIEANTAFVSQTLIHLKNNYCNYKKCLNCQIGNKIITSQL